MYTMSEPSNRINSMNQHFLLQNIKVVNYRCIKNVTLPNILACTKPFASQLTGKKALCNFKWYFFYPKIGSIWRVNCSLQARIFDKVAFFYHFYEIFLYFDVKSVVGSLNLSYSLVHMRYVYAVIAGSQFST